MSHFLFLIVFVCAFSFSLTYVLLISLTRGLLISLVSFRKMTLTSPLISIVYLLSLSLMSALTLLHPFFCWLWVYSVDFVLTSFSFNLGQ